MTKKLLNLKFEVPRPSNEDLLLLISATTISVALASGAAGFTINDRQSISTAFILLSYGALVLFLWKRSRHMEWRVVYECLWAGLLCALLLLALLSPRWFPIYAFLPPVVAVLALSEIQRQMTRWLIIASSSVIVTVGALRDTLVAPRLALQWPTGLIQASIFGVFVVTLLGLWSYRRRHLGVERPVSRAQQRYTLAVQNAQDGVWDWDLQANQLIVSTRWKAILGCTAQQFSRSPDEWFQRVHTEDRDRVQQEVLDHIAGHTSHFVSQHRLVHQDGGYRWVLSRGRILRDHLGTATHLIGVLTDITEFKVTEERLRYAAAHDTLTGLPNRDALMVALSTAIADAQSTTGQSFALLLLNLDRFTNVNESLGHPVGDALLIAIAERMRSSVRPIDFIARPGSDEFAVLLTDLRERDDALDVAQRLHQSLRTPLVAGDHDLVVTTAIGIVHGKARYERAEQVLRDAASAVHRAKALGAGRSAVFDPVMYTHARTTLQLESDLRRAVERGELAVWYQPIVALDTGRLTGVEALLRWPHPHHGWIAPNTAIRLAEETGLIVALGAWVLRTACEQMQAWQTELRSAAGLTLSVNVSGLQLGRPDLLEYVWTALARSGLPANQLRLELTESVFIGEADAATQLLTQLRAVGVQVALDDFGTGYASLSTLHHRPVDVLKVDQAFVRRMGIANDQGEIVRTIVNLGHQLGMSVVAEGIETATQRAMLQELQCDYGQGYLFAKPLNSTAITALIASGQEW